MIKKTAFDTPSFRIASLLAVSAIALPLTMRPKQRATLAMLPANRSTNPAESIFNGTLLVPVAGLPCGA